MVKKGITTYFLAQKSGLFRPGAATILANSPLKTVTKPKLGLRKEGQKKLGRGGGQSSGGLAAVGGGGGYVGPLDLTSRVVAAAYGQRALSAASLGQPLWSIRRDSDDTEQTFSSDSLTGDAPTGDVVAFLNGANGFGTSWKSQSGNPDHADQSIPALQPSWLPTTSNNRPGLSFSSQFLSTAGNISLPNSEFTIFCVAKVLSVSSGHGRILGMNGQNINFPDGPDLWLEFLSGDLGLEAGADGELFNAGNGGRYAIVPDAGAYYLFDTVWNSSTSDLRANGVAQNRNANYIYGDGNVGAINLPLAIGTDDPAGSPDFTLSGEILEMLIFPTVLGSSDRTAIRQNIATYYGITLL